MEYLSNQLSELPQILNLELVHQSNFSNHLNEDDLQWPIMEKDLKILKLEYLSNHWSDFPQILSLSLGDQTKIKYA